MYISRKYDQTKHKEEDSRLTRSTYVVNSCSSIIIDRINEDMFVKSFLYHNIWNTVTTRMSSYYTFSKL